MIARAALALGLALVAPAVVNAGGEAREKPAAMTPQSRQAVERVLDLRSRMGRAGPPEAAELRSALSRIRSHLVAILRDAEASDADSALLQEAVLAEHLFDRVEIHVPSGGERDQLRSRCEDVLDRVRSVSLAPDPAGRRRLALEALYVLDESDTLRTRRAREPVRPAIHGRESGLAPWGAVR